MKNNKPILLLLTLFPLLSYSQDNLPKEKENTLLIYMEGEQKHLLPLFENSLRILTDKSNTSKIYQNVINLNRIIGNRSFEQVLRNESSYYTKKQFQISELGKNILNKIGSSLTTHNYFLNIKAYVVATNIEFQLSLYKTDKAEFQKNINQLIINNIIEPITEEDFFINPLSTDIEEIINQHIIRLHADLCNYNPIPVITINDTIPLKYYGLGDSLKISGTTSIDFDTPKENLLYKWQQIGLDSLNVNSYKNININTDSPSQTLVLKDVGKFKLGLIVNDRIVQSDQAIIEFSVINKPTLNLSYNKFIPVIQISLANAFVKFKRDYKISNPVFSCELCDSIVREIVLNPNDDDYLNIVSKHDSSDLYLMMIHNYIDLQDANNSLLNPTSETSVRYLPSEFNIEYVPYRNNVQGVKKSLHVEPREYSVFNVSYGYWKMQVELDTLYNRDSIGPFNSYGLGFEIFLLPEISFKWIFFQNEGRFMALQYNYFYNQNIINSTGFWVGMIDIYPIKSFLYGLSLSIAPIKLKKIDTSFFNINFLGGASWEERKNNIRLLYGMELLLRF